MAGAVHPGRYDLLRRRVAGCDILAARPNRRISRRQHTAACRRAVRTRVAEEIVIGHVLAVAECGNIQGRVAHQRRQPRFGPLLIRERDHLLRKCVQRRSVRASAISFAACAQQTKRTACLPGAWPPRQHIRRCESRGNGHHESQHPLHPDDSSRAANP